MTYFSLLINQETTADEDVDANFRALFTKLAGDVSVILDFSYFPNKKKRKINITGMFKISSKHKYL